jgi:hypothetical protein
LSWEIAIESLAGKQSIKTLSEIYVSFSVKEYPVGLSQQLVG